MRNESFIDTYSMPKFIGIRKQAEISDFVYDFHDTCEKKHEKVRKLHHRDKKSYKWNQDCDSIEEIIENIKTKDMEFYAAA